MRTTELGARRRVAHPLDRRGPRGGRARPGSSGYCGPWAEREAWGQVQGELLCNLSGPWGLRPALPRTSDSRRESVRGEKVAGAFRPRFQVTAVPRRGPQGTGTERWGQQVWQVGASA